MWKNRKELIVIYIIPKGRINIKKKIFNGIIKKKKKKKYIVHEGNK